MAQYLMMWELDHTRIPVDQKERATSWTNLVNLVKHDRERGLIKEWGAFIGEMGGFITVEGEQLDVALMLQQYAPYVTFKTMAYSTLNLVEQMIHKMGQ